MKHAKCTVIFTTPEKSMTKLTRKTLEIPVGELSVFLRYISRTAISVKDTELRLTITSKIIHNCLELRRNKSASYKAAKVQ